MRVASSVGLALGLALAAAAPVHAETPADAAFKRGRELFKAGQFAQACAAFEDSQRLDPQLGTQFNLAQCDEKIGKLATAAKLYAELLEHDANPSRKASELDLAGKLAPRIPRLHVQLEHPPADLAVTVDGAPANAAADIPVDVGAHTVAITAAGFAAVTTTVTVASEGVVVPIVVALQPVAPAAAPAITAVAAPPPVVADTPRAGPPRLALISAAVGGAAIVGGIVAGVLANGKWSDAKAVCNGLTCATQGDLDQANALGAAARTRAGVSTGLFVVGGALATAGVVLWVRARGEHDARDTRVTGFAAPGVGGLTLSGRF